MAIIIHGGFSDIDYSWLLNAFIYKEDSFMTTTSRVQWIDRCKGFAILLVILGHTMRTDLSLVYIYGFHMPLFFFLSGLVCNTKKYTWHSFLLSRINQLVLPYIVFYLLTWLYWLFIERSFRPLGMEWWQPLIGLVYGAQWGVYMSHNGILWFLPCLFVTEVLFFALKRITNTWIQFVAVVALAGVGFLFRTNLPWCLNIACVALQFFFVGNFCRVFLLNEDVVEHKIFEKAFSLLALTIYILLSSLWMNRVNMATNHYGNIIVFELLAFLGIGGIVFLYKWQSRCKIGTGRGYLGRNTLVIFALHQPILRIIRFLGERVFPSFPVEANLGYALAADIVVVLCLIPLIWLYNKYGLPVLKKLYL
jgi:fucose 4-O-acetylase-like acetyltransferase